MPNTPDIRLPLLFAAMASFIVLGAYQAVLGPVLPVYQQMFALETATAGWLISTLGIGSFLGIAGMYFVGHHVTPRLALGAMAVGAALLALAPGWITTLGGGILFGMGYGSVATLFNARIMVAFGVRGPAMVSLINALYSVGAIAAPLLFVGLGSDPGLIFGIIAAIALTIIVVSGPAGRARAVGVANTSGFRWHPPILVFGALAIGFEVCLTGLAPSALILTGIAPEQAAELLSMFFAAFLLGRIGLTVLANRVPSFAVFTFALAFTAVCLLGCALYDPVWFYPPIGAAVGLFFPGFFVTASGKMGSDSRVAPVVLGTCQIGAVLSPLVVAGLIPQMGDKGFFWLMAGSTGLLALMALLFYRAMTR
jgi:FHS family glucose/mannose:H+ symporter-like MFS transporter